MYHLFLPISLYYNCNQLAHLFEHCVGNSILLSYHNYISYEDSIEGITTNFYIHYTIPNKYLLNTLIKNLSQPITQITYEQESSRIKDEMKDAQYGQGLFEYIYNNILHQNISIIVYPEYSYEQLITYQHNNSKQYIITDKNYNIIENTINKNTIEGKNIITAKNKTFLYDDTMFTLTYTDFQESSEYYIYDFLHKVKEKWLNYYTYHHENLYFSYILYFFPTPKTLSIICTKEAHDILQKIDQRFFEAVKKWYLKENDLKKNHTIVQLAQKQPLSNAQDIIKNFSYSDYLAFININ